ncbi:hypothetical protein HD599_001169 [Conyzicola lurida]|uniref:Uncharacterized protein n=1 Tax=Conyzicola lurida TaxID=1172621 RepID=A0A841AMA8_9MICO|nr:hypothetical protein [Conyzicola lurida]
MLPLWQDRLAITRSIILAGPWMRYSGPFYTAVESYAIGSGASTGGKSTIECVTTSLGTAARYN